MVAAADHHATDAHRMGIVSRCQVTVSKYGRRGNCRQSILPVNKPYDESNIERGCDSPSADQPNSSYNHRYDGDAEEAKEYVPASGAFPLLVGEHGWNPEGDDDWDECEVHRTGQIANRPENRQQHGGNTSDEHLVSTCLRQCQFKLCFPNGSCWPD